MPPKWNNPYKLALKWQIASLAVQELHDGLQDVVSILRHAAGVPYVGTSLHLRQDVSHLLHVLLNMRLETAERKEKNIVSRSGDKSH